MAASTPVGDGWIGPATFKYQDRFHGIHTKSPTRPPIAGTRHAAFAQARDEDQRNNRKNYLGIGDRIREVYHSSLQFEEADSEWHFGRALGAGAFGLVASWYKNTGERYRDQIVTKSETPNQHTSVHSLRPDVSSEAFIMAQLNQRRSPGDWPNMGIVGLRGYKYLHGDTSTRNGHTFQARPGFLEQPFYREWRTYMENCWYGNIRRTVLTYRAWGYHLPEAFVWWTFFWLAQGCKAMDLDIAHPFEVWTDHNETHLSMESFVLANDIKSDNCFYGFKRDIHSIGAPFDHYPAARIGDFGLAQVMRFDHHNRRRNLQPGTRDWVAPEKRRVKMGVDEYGNPTYPFFDQRRVDYPNFQLLKGVPQNTESHCIGPEANLWGVAVVVSMLMTGESMPEICRRIDWHYRPANPTRDNPNMNAYLYRADAFPTHLIGDEDYSPELKALVSECSRMEPLKRPNLDTVIETIKEGIVRERHRLEDAFGTEAAIREATRVVFSNEEWHDVPQGPFMMMPRPTPGFNEERVGQMWRDFSHNVEAWQDPAEPPLYPPGRTAEVVPPNLQDHVRPFQGPDMMIYVNPGDTAGYYQGPPLPKGGRAQPPVFQDRNWNFTNLV